MPIYRMCVDANVSIYLDINATNTDMAFKRTHEIMVGSFNKMKPNSKIILRQIEDITVDRKEDSYEIK